MAAKKTESRNRLWRKRLEPEVAHHQPEATRWNVLTNLNAGELAGGFLPSGIETKGKDQHAERQRAQRWRCYCGLGYLVGH
jgi:hypothetical protein